MVSALPARTELPRFFRFFGMFATNSLLYSGVGEFDHDSI